MKNKVLWILLVVTVCAATVVGCSGREMENKKENKKENIKEEKVLQTEIDNEVEEEEKHENIQVEEVEDTAIQKVDSSTEKSTTKKESTTQNKTQNKTQNTTQNSKPTINQPLQTPEVSEPEQKECEHQYALEHKEYNRIKHYIYGCNGCGYPLFTFQGNDAVNLPNLYSHPAYYSEKLGMDCVGGGFHSEVYYQGYCYLCHDEVRFRSCMFSETGKMCVKNTALGSYTKIEYGRNPNGYFKSCRCGGNMICVGGSGNGGGLMLLKETCVKCGHVETYPKR